MASRLWPHGFGIGLPALRREWRDGWPRRAAIESLQHGWSTVELKSAAPEAGFRWIADAYQKTKHTWRSARLRQSPLLSIPWQPAPVGQDQRFSGPACDASNESQRWRGA